MLIIDSRPALAFALDRLQDPTLKALLALRRDQLAEYDDDLINFAIIRPGDPLSAFELAFDFSPLVCPVDGTRFGEPGYSPPFEWVASHPGWLEAPVIFDDSGAGVILIVEDRDGVEADLITVMRAYAVPSQELRAIAP